MFSNQIDLEDDSLSLDDIIVQLLESIAKEEVALSAIIKAEASKIQAFVGRELDFPTCPTTEDIMVFSRTTSHLIDSIVMKEWLLLRKLEAIMELDSQSNKECSADKELYTDEFYGNENEE